MSKVQFKASELRGPLKLMLPTSDSRKSNSAKRVTVCITETKDEVGILYQTVQVGFALSLFKPIALKGGDAEEQPFDITVGERVCCVETRELDRALASFASQSVTMTLEDDGSICVEGDTGSRVKVQGMRVGETAERLMQTWAEDADTFARDARRTPIVELADALLPATRIVTLPGNASDMKGVHLHFGPEEGIRIIGAHTQAMFVHGKAEQEDDDAYIIMPDAAKRLREALLREMDGDDACRKEAMVLLAAYGRLAVCCGHWMMELTTVDICHAECDSYMEMPGQNVFEADRVALMQALDGLRMMGETECYVTFLGDALHLEGEAPTHRGERTLTVPCTRYGTQDELPRRKYPILPLTIMLSAASAAENAKTVKLLTDLDDHMLCCECEEYRVFVR